LTVDPSRLTIIQYECLGQQRAEIVGIGELNADHVRAHPPARPLDPTEIEELDAAWAALVSPDPAPLMSLIASGPGRLPFLRRDLRFLLDRYPDSRSGLNLFDRLLLQYVPEYGPRAVRVIGHVMTHDFHRPDWVGDVYLFARMRRLAGADHPYPLLTLNSAMASIHETTVALTDAGPALLPGDANPVHLNGIEDRIPGVHLNPSAGRVWFRQEGRLIPALDPVGRG